MKTARIGIISSLTGNSMCDITAGLFHTKYRQNVQLILYHSTLGDNVAKVKEGILRSLDFIISQNQSQVYLDELYITRGGAESDLISLYQDQQFYDRIAKLFQLGVIVNLAIGHAKDSTPELSRLIQKLWLKHRFKFLLKGRLPLWQKLKLYYAPVIFSVPAEVGVKLDRIYRGDKYSLNALLPVFRVKDSGVQLDYFIQPGFTYNLFVADKHLFASEANPEFLSSELGLFSLWQKNVLTTRVPNIFTSKYFKSCNKTFNFFSLLLILSLMLNNERELKQRAEGYAKANEQEQSEWNLVNKSAPDQILFPQTKRITEFFYRLNKASVRAKLKPKSKLINTILAFYEQGLRSDKLEVAQAFQLEVTSKAKSERLRVMLAELLEVADFGSLQERESFFRHGIEFAQKHWFAGELAHKDNLNFKQVLKFSWQSLLKFSLLFGALLIGIYVLVWWGK